ncbi:hypothetical protein Tco_0642612 [Tanacetum coccineum]
MLNPNPDTGIDSILNLNIESTSLVDVPVTTNDEIPPSSVTTLPPPPIPLIQPLQQTLVSTPTSVPSTSLQNLPTFGSLFKFEDRVKSLEDDFLEFKQTNLFAEAVSLIPCIVDKYLANQMNEAVKAAVQLHAPKDKMSKSTGSSKEGSKSKIGSNGKSAQAEEQVHTTTQLPAWFQKPAKPSTPDCDWNKTFPAVYGPIQPWISTLARKKDPRESFNELMDTPLDFSAFVLNRLKVDTLTPELLVGLTFELMKGSYKSLVELEYFLEVVYKATTDQLDWNNPEGQQYPHDLRKPLPLIPNSQGHRVIPFDHFINNELAYLSGGISS